MFSLKCISSSIFSHYAKVHLLLRVPGNHVKKESDFTPRDWVGEKAASFTRHSIKKFTLKVESICFQRVKQHPFALCLNFYKLQA